MTEAEAREKFEEWRKRQEDYTKSESVDGVVVDPSGGYMIGLSYNGAVRVFSVAPRREIREERPYIKQ